MSELLKSDAAWTWGLPQQTAFAKVKEMTNTVLMLAFNDSKKLTVVCVHMLVVTELLGFWCKVRVTMQLRPEGFYSRTLTETEVR